MADIVPFSYTYTTSQHLRVSPLVELSVGLSLRSLYTIRTYEVVRDSDRSTRNHPVPPAIPQAFSNTTFNDLGPHPTRGLGEVRGHYFRENKN